ncbi:Bidirectional sugar transporter SWEET1 [Linum perenne]
MTDIPHFIFGILGNAFAAFLFLAPTITFRRIIKNKSTEEFSGVPYPMTLLNCLLSAWYGLPFVSKDNLLVTTINGTGAAIEIIYVIIFLVFAPKKQKAKIGGIFAAVLSVFAAVSLISYFALHGNTRKLFCGTAATVFSIIMYASPLSIMRLVIKTKSVEFMPLFLSLFIFLCGTSWFIYGLLGRDPFIAVSVDLTSSNHLIFIIIL